MTWKRPTMPNLSNGDLLDAIEGRYEILVTLDCNLTYQQKIAQRQLTVTVLQVADQTPASFKALVPKIELAIDQAKAGKVLNVHE